MLRPKRSSSHPVSRITVIFSVGNGPASRASLAAKPSWVSLFSHVLPKKTCSALGLLWARPLQGRWAVREAGGAACSRPLDPGPSRHPAHQEKQTGGSICGFQRECPGNPQAWVISSPWVSVELKSLCTKPVREEAPGRLWDRGGFLAQEKSDHEVSECTPCPQLHVDTGRVLK